MSALNSWQPDQLSGCRLANDLDTYMYSNNSSSRVLVLVMVKSIGWSRVVSCRMRA